MCFSNKTIRTLTLLPIDCYNHYFNLGVGWCYHTLYLKIMKTPTEFLLLLILGIGALQKLTTRPSGRPVGPLCWAWPLSELQEWDGARVPRETQACIKGRYNCLRGPAAARLGSPFVSTGPFPVSADWLSTGDLIGRALSSTESHGRAGSGQARGSGEVCLVAAGCVGRNRKHPGDFREQRFG